MFRSLFKALSFYWLFKAAAKGPRGLATYAVRKAMRRSVNRQVRKIR